MVAGLALISNHRIRDEAVAKPPPLAGVWSVIPDAPIAPRAHAAVAWWDGRAVFFGGSDVNRSTVRVDGAALDVDTMTWDQFAGPGWGHPGLTGSQRGSEVIMSAKDGTSGARHGSLVAPTFTRNGGGSRIVVCCDT